MRRRYFQEDNRPKDVLDCGVHSGRKFEEVYLDHEPYVKWGVGTQTSADVEFDMFQVLSDEIDGP